MQKIYVAMHKPYTVPENPLYVPLQVGAEGRAAFCAVRDNTGKNISDLNRSFCELTALYWMRYNTDDDVAGLVHYRRYFASKRRRGGDKWNRILGEDELTELMQDLDMILPVKRHYFIETTFSHYAHAHHERDLQIMRQIIQEQCPQYRPAFDAVMNKRSGHRFNMFVMKKEVLHDYCSWLFPLLFELERRIDISDYDDYNKRVFGFIGERLLDVWLMKREYRYTELKVLEIEEPNWLIKGGSFLWRKIRYSLFGKKNRGGKLK